MTMISKYISFAEATKSQTAVRRGIKNEPDSDQLEAMKHVAKNIFDPVREWVGGPLHPSSFFRSKELNKAIGGSSLTSQHMKGEAIDIDCDFYGNSNNTDVFNYIKNNLEFDQLIGEYPDKDGKFSWVHVSLKKNKAANRKQVLVKLKGRYINFNNYKIGDV